MTKPITSLFSPPFPLFYMYSYPQDTQYYQRPRRKYKAIRKPEEGEKFWMTQSAVKAQARYRFEVEVEFMGCRVQGVYFYM